MVYYKSYIYSPYRLYGTIGQSSEKYFMLLRDCLLEQLVIQHKGRKGVISLVTSNTQELIQEVTGAELLNGSATV